MTEMFLANVPTLILLGLFVAAVHLIKFIASRFWNFK
jgi:hypothetical protein